MGAYINLVWGEMVAAWLLHLFVPFFMSRIVTNMFYDTSVLNRMLILIGFTMLFSFVLQFIFLIIIQSTSCNTVKNFDYIAYGSIIGAFIVGGMMCIPAFLEPMRTVVSQIYAPHKPLMTPQLEELEKYLLFASVPKNQIGGAKSSFTPAPPPEKEEIKITNPINTKEEPVKPSEEPIKTITNPLKTKETAANPKDEPAQKKYDKQTFDEFTIGSALWAAFGGAYGVGLGSLWAGKC